MPEEGGSPSARYIINCFGGDSIRNNREVENRGFADDADDEDDEQNVVGGQLGHHSANDYPSSQAQIEMFEANPDADVEHTRLSGSTWAELRVMNKRGAEAAEMRHCQADIKRMLSRLEASMQFLLQTQHVQPQGPAAPVEEEEAGEVRDRSIDDIILSAARKAKSKTDKPASARKLKATAPASKHKGAASATKQKPAATAAAAVSSPKPKKTH